MKVKFKDGTELECVQIYLSDKKLTARTNKRKNHRHYATEVEKITSQEWEIAVSSPSSSEDGEIPEPYENAIVWGVNLVLRERIKHLAEKCAEQKEILEILKRNARHGFDQIAWKNTILLLVEEGAVDYETIKRWLDED